MKALLLLLSGCCMIGLTAASLGVAAPPRGGAALEHTMAAPGADYMVFKGAYRADGTSGQAAVLTASLRDAAGAELAVHTLTLPGTDGIKVDVFDEWPKPSDCTHVRLKCVRAEGVFADGWTLRPGRLRDYPREFFPALPPSGAVFPIFGWCPPGTGGRSKNYRNVAALYNSERVRAEYSYANFTVWGDRRFGSLPVTTPHLAQTAPPREGPLWAVVGKDEPLPKNFPSYLAEKERVARILPDTPYFNNLLPCHSRNYFPTAEAYLGYLKKYRDEFSPRRVTVDIYVLRNRPPVYYLEFWNQLYDMQHVFGGFCDWGLILQVLHFGSMRSPTDAELRFQAYSTLAFGAKIIGWFTFLEPIDRKLAPARDAIIQKDGMRSFHYAQIRRLNGEILTLGPTLLALRCRHTRLSPVPGKQQRYRQPPRPEDAVTAVHGGRFAIGEFADATGREVYVLLVNTDFVRAAQPSFALNRRYAGLREVARNADAPRTFTVNADQKVSIPFAAGDGRLFRLIPRSPE